MEEATTSYVEPAAEKIAEEQVAATRQSGAVDPRLAGVAARQAHTLTLAEDADLKTCRMACLAGFAGGIAIQQVQFGQAFRNQNCVFQLESMGKVHEVAPAAVIAASEHGTATAATSATVSTQPTTSMP